MAWGVDRGTKRVLNTPKGFMKLTFLAVGAGWS
jgi:hypothetical protein